MVWVRHRAQATRYCRVVNAYDSGFITGCRGRFAVADVNQFEIHDNPPVEKRCGACVKDSDATA